MHSTETALLKVKHDISSALDRHNSVLFVMLDLSAAFDTIEQNQLFGLLRDEYGKTGKALSWFSTYLEDRTQRVQVETTTSDHVPLKCGVPQGSVLGPVIFTLYTAPIQRIIRKHGVKHHTQMIFNSMWNMIQQYQGQERKQYGGLKPASKRFELGCQYECSS